MELQLLVGSEEFWKVLETDINRAEESVRIQTLSFEGDDAGMALSNAIRESSAKVRRVIIDCFTRHFITDRWIFAPRNRFDSEHREEVLATRQMIENNRKEGIEVKWVNPFGFLYRKAPVRNHKKMVLIDGDTTYIGGINFSEHNFEWHDMMLRIEDREVAEFMRQDFETTWSGENRLSRKEFDGLTISLIDGQTNEKSFDEVFDLIGAARETIFIESPYLSWPFYDHLRSAVERGVRVTVLMPEENNRAWVQQYTEWEVARSGIRLYNYLPKMTHLKAMLVDEEALVLGSSNFDYFSYRTQQEVIAVVRRPDLVEDFIKRVRDVDLAQSKPAVVAEARKSTVLLYGFIRAMGKLAVTLARI